MENQTSHPSGLSSNNDSPGNRPIKIMPLGDSITDGYFVPGGYRIDLQPAMENRGYAIEFVGSLSNGPETLLSQHHEGHSGWRIEEICDRVADWLQTFQPDIILLLIGTNNIAQGHQVETASYCLNQLLDRIFQTAPNVKLFLASIPPMSQPMLNEEVIQYNQKSEKLVKEKQQAGKPIDFVDLYNILNLDDLPDGVHPNREGFRKMAGALEACLSAHLS
ncbi:SGNH/GDSL hydrolase family protein [Microcoleus sp. CAWBG58]|uniref:SGNH/GDSL hydrolase family protein n=1 Tax=Microcoleus sp. CAWBG58 TaxID=2841651 RepID=UPI0025DD6424|nr:SGNH/GDSL hydrolase family protein [Microcoleus sp. CAWBG58]